MKIRFKLSGTETVFSSPPGISLLEAARMAGIDIDAPCSGNGTCGKCSVIVVHESGAAAGVPSPKEERRLACQTNVESDLTVIIPEETTASKKGMKITDLGGGRERGIFAEFRKELISSGFSGGSGFEIISLKLEKPELDDPEADRERLIRSLAAALPGEEKERAEIEISLHALRKLPRVLREGDFSCSCVVRRKKNEFLVMDVFAPGVERPLVPGLALDIGTTSVAALLSDLASGEVIASASRGNSQARYGADVINRIIESSKPGGLERLRSVLFDDCIVPLIRELAAAAGIETPQIYRAAVAANTTMTHFFAGVSPEHLRLEPYVPAFFRAGNLRASDFGLPIHPEAEVALAPSVGSYVGGDISAGLFASMIFRRETNSLFIDLGTNGELVFGGGEFLMTCACSAGPAFEGGDISCGMRAAPGAIDSVKIAGGSFEPDFTVVGGERPAGICGSGLIDLAGELFASGLVNPRGKFTFEGEAGLVSKINPRLRRDEWGMASYVLAFAHESGNGREIFISEADIDNFIRAKGAIFSAVRTMLAMLGFGAEDIDAVYIAGGIGSGINIESAIRIGMLPAIPLERYRYIGNTSLAGAYAMLTSEKAARKVDEIAANMTYLELSSHPSYMDEFVAACFLPHTNRELFL